MRRSASVGWARGGQEGRGGRTRALSGPTHFGPKSEAEMGAHGHDRTALSVWVGPLGCHFPIFLSARTRSDAGWSFGSARWRCPKVLSLNPQPRSVIAHRNTEMISNVPSL
jgi:hypothetical protein